VLIAGAWFLPIFNDRSPDFRALALSAAGSAVYTGAAVIAVAVVAQLVWRRSAADDAGTAPEVSNCWRMLTG
jgi:hypothetical protein